MISTPVFSRMLSASMLVALAAGAPGAHAAWEAVPELSMTADLDDNVVLDSAEEQAAGSAGLEAGARFSNFNQRGEIFLEPSIFVDKYADSEDSRFESEDLFLRAGGRYQWQTVAMNYRMYYSEESVLRTELADALPDDLELEDPIDVDTGRLDFFDETRERLINNGNLNFRLSPRNTLRFGLRRSHVSYSGETRSPRRTGFDQTTLTMALDREVDDRNNVTASVFVSDFNAEETGNDTDTVGVEGTFSRPLTETWSFSLTAGVQRSDYTFIDDATGQLVDNADANVSFRTGFEKEGQRTVWNMGLSRVINPNSNGFLNVRDGFRAFVRREFSPRLTGQFGLRYFESRTLDNVRNIDNREYARVGVDFEWAMSRTLFLTFGADSTRQEFVRESLAPATSNSVFVGFTFRGLSRRNQ